MNQPPRSIIFLKPSFFSIFLTVFGVTIFSLLGVWQFNRGQYKAILLENYQLRSSAAPITLARAIHLKDPQFIHVILQGYFDNTHTFLLDNRFYNHQVGYEVITPLLPLHDNHCLLINRGWVAAPLARIIKPKIPFIQDLQTITGIISIPPKTSLFKIAQLNETWPKRIPSIDMEALGSQLQKPLYPYLLLQDPSKQQFFIRHWVITVTTPQKHYGYAVQWFLFALMSVAIFLGLHFKYPERIK